MDNRRPHDVWDVRWTILRYPSVTLAPKPTHFDLKVTTPGVVRVSGTGLDTDLRRVTFTAQCVVGDVSLPLVAGLTAPDTLTVVSEAEKFGGPLDEDCFEES